MGIKKTIQPFLIIASRCQPFNELSTAYYKAATFIFSKVFSRCQQIKSIYLRSSFATDDLVLWDSDIDFTVVLVDMDINKEARFLRTFWRIYKILKIPFPFIKHIDIFNEREFESNALHPDPRLYYLVDRLNLLYGKQRYTGRNNGAGSALSFRLHSWNQFMQWFYTDKFSDKKSVRKYNKFFKKIIIFFGKAGSNSENLKLISARIEENDFCLSKTEELVALGLWRTLNILNDFYRNNTMPEYESVKFYYKQKDRGISKKGPFYNEAKLFIGYLTPCLKGIKSIFIDSGSIQNNYQRVWIVAKDGLETADFVKLMHLAKRAAKDIFNFNISPYIFLENTLNLFLTRQRLWLLEYFHLVRHAKLIYGSDIFDRLKGPTDISMAEMILSSIIIYKNWLRNITNKYPLSEMKEISLNILSWKALLDKKIIASTYEELINTHVFDYDGVEMKLYNMLASEKHIDKHKFYFFITSLLDEIYDKCNFIIATKPGSARTCRSICAAVKFSG